MDLGKIEEKKNFGLRKFSLFGPSHPKLWRHYFLFLTFPKWSFSQVIDQLSSFYFSQKAALRAIEAENWG